VNAAVAAATVARFLPKVIGLMPEDAEELTADLQQLRHAIDAIPLE
jgi:hypothetical protein